MGKIGDHRTSVDHAGATWTGRCTCGWQGREWPSYVHAMTDADEHVLGATDGSDTR